jgi:RHH-type proline utilization regulon transcriptional repressor/proline dehydrogenase/delta 1-pyrroline-5-carboxylate dehydrogenase
MHVMQEAAGSALEQRTLELGREVFARARRAKSGEGWLDRRLMEIGMRDERVKAQLFRLVDVLPVLNTPQQVNRHLDEYLAEAREQLPWIAQEAMRWWGIPRNGLLGKVLAGATLAGTRRMARRFIAAADADEALAAARKLRDSGLTFTVDVLGEAVLAASEAIAYQRYYLDLITRLSDEACNWPENPVLDRDHLGPIPKVNVSVKLSSLFSQFDPIDPDGTGTAVRNRLRPILRLARERGVFINVDMEQYSYKDVTLRIFREILDEEEFRDWPDVGIAIQAYLRDCGEDLESLADWAEARGTGVWVRLVKGAYWDYETIIAAQNGWPVPVWSVKPETDANYERQSEFLMRRYDVLRPAIASHNVRSIAHAMALAEEFKVPQRAIEFQLLYGMADPIKEVLVGMGQRVRVYAPVGKLLPGMAYLVRRLLENTSNESFLRAGFLERVPEEKLLMNPMQILRKRRRATATSPSNGRRASDLDAPFENEPLADFSRADARDAMRAALETVRGQLGRSYPLVIDGRRIETGDWIASVDPSERSRMVGRVAAGKAEHARAVIEAAKRAFPGWRDTPPIERARMLLRVAEIIRRRRFELAAWQVYECAKPWREADGDVAEAIDYCEYYAREMARLARPWGRDLPGESNENCYEPRGVAVAIAPWNFPLAIILGMTTASLVTGNTAIMKPAEQSPIIAAKLMEIFEEAGFPPGVVNFLSGVGEEVGPVLANHPDVAVVAFTGSKTVGLLLGEQASHAQPGQTHVKRVITEMGGKNAIIVDDDADLDEAVHGVVASAFGYAGQKCSACSRVIVLESVYDTFVSRLVEATASLKVGPAEDPGTSVPAVIDAEAHQRIGRAIERGKSEPGVRLAHAGDVAALTGRGNYVAPQIFADVPPASFLAQEEIFGPVLALIRAKDLDDALAIANGTQYALTGGLYSRSPASIDRVRREFRVGNLYINRKCTGALVERQAFGGFKMSGVGSKAGGPDYLLQFMWPRTITENTMRRGFAPTEVAIGDGAREGGGI